jgi:prepilin-type N-terminal cleavage/methylation domain-containing protein
MNPDKHRERRTFMKNEQGFSLIELLIVVAIIAIIAAIAVPSMLTARMAANETGSIQGCRTIGSAEVAYAAVNNQNYDTVADLVTNSYLDSRYNTGFNGYTYATGTVTGASAAATAAIPAGFAYVATPITVGSSGRYTYGIAADQVVRWLAGTPTPANMSAGTPIGTASSGS